MRANRYYAIPKAAIGIQMVTKIAGLAARCRDIVGPLDHRTEFKLAASQNGRIVYSRGYVKIVSRLYQRLLVSDCGQIG